MGAVGFYLMTRLGVTTRLTTMGAPQPPEGANVCDDLRRICLTTAASGLSRL
jgi:hypothetical protein